MVAATIAEALLVPRRAVGHGDTLQGPPMPIWENNTELGIGIVVGGTSVAGLLFLTALGSRSE